MCRSEQWLWQPTANNGVHKKAAKRNACGFGRMVIWAKRKNDSRLYAAWVCRLGIGEPFGRRSNASERMEAEIYHFVFFFTNAKMPLLPTFVRKLRQTFLRIAKIGYFLLSLFLHFS
jgi:hypothetical protein